MTREVLVPELLQTLGNTIISRRQSLQALGLTFTAPVLAPRVPRAPHSKATLAIPSYAPLEIPIAYELPLSMDAVSDTNHRIATKIGNVLKNRPPLSPEQKKAEDMTIDEIINGLNISGEVRKVLREKKQFFTPVVVHYTAINKDGNAQKYSEPTSILVVDNNKVYETMQVTPEDGSVTVSELRDPSRRENRVKFIASEILEPLIYAQKSSGKPVACEVGAEKFPTPGLWLDMLPMQSMVVGMDYKAATQTDIDQPDEEIIGWITSASKRGVAITAQLSLEEVKFSDYDFQRVIMPQPGNTRLIMDAMVERMSRTNPDAFCLAYLDPYYTAGLDGHFPPSASEAERNLYQVEVKRHNDFDLEVNSPYKTQNRVIREIESRTYETGKKVEVNSRMSYIPYGEINQASDPDDPQDPRRVSRLEMTGYLRRDYTGTPVPVAVLRPKSDTRDPDLPDFDKVPTREFAKWVLLGGLLGAAAALGLNGLLGGKGDSGGSAVPA